MSSELQKGCFGCRLYFALQYKRADGFYKQCILYTPQKVYFKITAKNSRTEAKNSVFFGFFFGSIDFYRMYSETSMSISRY